VKSAPSRRGTSTYPEDSAPENTTDATAAGPGYGASCENGVLDDKVANDGAREECMFARIHQGGTLDAYRDTAGSSGDLRSTLSLGRADCLYKLHRALDGAGVCISVVFAIRYGRYGTQF